MKALLSAIGLTIVASCSQPGQQSNEQSGKPESQAVTQQTGQKVDPVAVAALNHMSDYLRTLKSMEVSAKTNVDEVLVDTGQKVQFSGEGLYRIEKPNAFFLDTKTDRRHRQFYFDGKTFTIYSPRLKTYAQKPAPSTITEMVDQMRANYDIELPLADLFYWGTEKADPAGFQYASHIGFALIGGQACDQYAMREGDVDWQIWIARGDRPLPLKVVITSYTKEAQPQFTSELTWKTNPRFNAKTFTFSAPKDAHQIEIASY